MSDVHRPPSTAAFSLRPATPEDVAKILAIEAKVHVAPWDQTHLDSEFSKPYSHFLVLTDDETDEVIAGYIVFWTLFDEAQILNVAVDLPHRGLGYAKLLVRSAINEAVRKGIKRVLLDVRKSNLAAIQLYQGVGFVITHVRKGFYSNAEDAYQMALYMEDDGLKF